MAIDLALKRQGEKAWVIVTLHSKKKKQTLQQVKQHCFQNSCSLEALSLDTLSIYVIFQLYSLFGA